MTAAQGTRARPLAVDDPEGVALLRQGLDAAGYTAAGIMDALGSSGPFTRDLTEIPYYVRALDEGAALSTLIGLFLLGLTVEADEAAGALAPLTLERAEALGLLHREDGAVTAAVDVVPVGELLLASDRFEGEALPTHGDHVYGPTPPARALASLTVRRRVRSALDLGVGSGLLTLLVAEHAERVVGVDLNPRALGFAEFNALLNGAHNVEVRSADMLAPVDETFDLVVSNPPYTIAPDPGSGYLFRDGGQRGDVFCERLVRHVPTLLEEGGIAQVLVSWAFDGEERWSEPLRAWVEGSGCDALLVRYRSYAPLEHAAEWNRALAADPAAYAETLDRWVRFYEESGIVRIGWGVAVLRRRRGENWVWAETLPGERMDQSGHHVLRVLENQDGLAALGDDRELFDRVLALAPDHRLDRTFHFEDGAGIVHSALLRLDGGFRFTLAVDIDLISVLSELDGQRTLREALAAVRGEDEGLAGSALGLVRRLLELGFLVFAPQRES